MLALFSPFSPESYLQIKFRYYLVEVLTDEKQSLVYMHMTVFRSSDVILFQNKQEAQSASEIK